MLQTLHDLIDNEREGFLIFNIVLALYFASNGLDNLMTQFNNTNLFKEKRDWWEKRLIAIILVLIFVKSKKHKRHQIMPGMAKAK